MIKPPSNPFLSQTQPQSIIQLVGGPESQGLGEKEIFMAELQLFSEFHKQKILEKEDRHRIDQFKKSSIKGLLLANGLGGVLNRLLTLLKYGRLDFMNLYLIPRLIIRFGIFGILNANLISLQIINLGNLQDDLNKKYIPRYKEYMMTGGHPMAVLNKNYLNDPDITQDEKDMCLKFPKMNPGQMN